MEAVAAQPDLKALVHSNARQSKALFADAEGASSRKRQKLSTDTELEKTALSVRLNAEYAHVRELPPALAQKQANALNAAKNKKRGKAGGAAPADGATGEEQKTMKLIEGIEEKKGGGPSSGLNSTALVQRTKQSTPFAQTAKGDNNPTTALSVARAQAHMLKPDWHPPVEADEGHIGTLGLGAEFGGGTREPVVRKWRRRPYHQDLGSGFGQPEADPHWSHLDSSRPSRLTAASLPFFLWRGQDGQVLGFRDKQGHSTLSRTSEWCLHARATPYSGRPCYWRKRRCCSRLDMRTRSNIHVLGGHKGTVADLKCQAADPQIITSSLDSTVRLWDLAAGKTMGVLTHHKKGVRALALHPTEFTFATGSTGSIKQWKCPEGAFMQNFEGHNSIINSLACNEDVLFSGGDNGSMSFWDWKTGHRFQSLDSIAQPGSLDAEAGIMSSTFDQTGMRLIVGEADKTIKIWKQDEKATEETHPLEWKPTLGQRKF
ncbi:hypothetical protein PG987_004202 [Apiospora arundinis]